MNGRIVCVLLAAGAAGAQAADIGYHVSTGVSHSDNIARTPNDEQAENVASAGLDFSILQRTRKLDIDTQANFAYLDYLDNTFDSELTGNFNGRARIDWIPRRFTWTFLDNFGQARIDPQATVTPQNRENVNYFTTGPDFFVGLTEDTRLRLSGRYSNVRYEDTPLDSDRLSGAVGLFHDLSAATNISLNAEREHIDFDTGPNDQDYDRDQAYLRYEGEGSRTRLAADLGFSRLERAEETSNGLVARLEVARQISSSSTVTLSAGREYSDASDGFRLSQTLGEASGLDAQPGVPTTDPFVSTYARLGWEFNRNRTGLGANVERFEDSYDRVTVLDRTRAAASAHLRRELTPALRATLVVRRYREDFDNLAANFDESSAIAGLEYRIGRRLSIGAQYQYYTRTSSDLPLTEFTENRFWLGLAYGRNAPQRVLFPQLQDGASSPRGR